MANRYVTTILVGGRCPWQAVPALLEVIAAEGLVVPATGKAFDFAEREAGAPLALCHYEAPWGRIARLERLCMDLGLPYVRWADDGSKAVFIPTLGVFDLFCDMEDGRTVLSLAEIERRDICTLAEAKLFLRMTDAPPPGFEVVL
jgi:hypothetical protein